MFQTGYDHYRGDCLWESSAVLRHCGTLTHIHCSYDADALSTLKNWF